MDQNSVGNARRDTLSSRSLYFWHTMQLSQTKKTKMHLKMVRFFLIVSKVRHFSSVDDIRFSLWNSRWINIFILTQSESFIIKKKFHDINWREDWHGKI